MMYSFLEQHTDGSWWCHPGSTFDTAEEAEKCFQERFWWDKERSHIIVKHEVEFPQDYSICSRNLHSFGFGGVFDYEIPCEEVSNSRP